MNHWSGSGVSTGSKALAASFVYGHASVCRNGDSRLKHGVDQGEWR